MQVHSFSTQLLTVAEAAHQLKLSRRSLQSLRLRGDGPAFVALNRRVVRYRPADLAEWIDRHAVRPELV